MHLHYCVLNRRIALSKLSASRGVVCAFCIVPVTLVAMALLVMVHGRNGKAERASTSASSSPSGTSTAAARSRMQASYAALPLAFEPNQGQTDAQVKYLARGSGYTLFLTANDAVFSLRSRQAKKESNAVVRMHLAVETRRPRLKAGIPCPAWLIITWGMTRASGAREFHALGGLLTGMFIQA